MLRDSIFDLKVLDVTAAKDNVFVDVLSGRKFIDAVASSLSSVRDNLLERDGASFGIDFVQSTNISIGGGKLALPEAETLVSSSW